MEREINNKKGDVIMKQWYKIMYKDRKGKKHLCFNLGTSEEDSVCDLFKSLGYNATIISVCLK